MGTRVDFYVGKGKDAEWIGSIAWDGYREAIDPEILLCKSESAFRHAFAEFIKDRNDATLPEQGWPWPWDDSGLTDCHYWFFDGRCWEGRRERDKFGEVYVPCDELYDKWLTGRERVEFPNMKDKQNVTLGNRSGVIIFQSK